MSFNRLWKIGSYIGSELRSKRNSNNLNYPLDTLLVILKKLFISHCKLYTNCTHKV